VSSLGVVLDGGCMRQYVSISGRTSTKGLQQDILSVLRLYKAKMDESIVHTVHEIARCDLPEPLGDGSVLPGSLSQLLLNPESLLGRLLRTLRSSTNQCMIP
jgi:hypothetical protein